MPDHLLEICSKCGLTFGSHHAGRSPYAYGYCPGHEGRMDYENGRGTTFHGSDEYKEVPYGTAAKP